MGTRAIYELREKAGKQILRKFGNEEKCLFCSLIIMVDSVKRQIQECGWAVLTVPLYYS